MNFINSTGDTCLTKAFACKAYDLVLEILRRDENPIRRETILRVTNKKKISGLEQAICHGRVEILRELTRWKNGRGDVIDLNVERLEEQTPLYYAIARLPNTRVPIKKFEAALRSFAGKHNPDAVEMLQCIGHLVNEQRVDLDAVNVNDNTALTFAAELGLNNIVAMLLSAGANVNHRFQGGGTALVRAIINDDCEMAKLLLEYKADYRLFVDAIGRPIYAMSMSEKMRRLIPARPS